MLLNLSIILISCSKKDSLAILMNQIFLIIICGLIRFSPVRVFSQFLFAAQRAKLIQQITLKGCSSP